MTKPQSGSSLSGPLLGWYDRHGRRDLPWQRHPTAYRVWVSEIMLQQTRVATVIPYYGRFMDRYPRVQGLAGAELDEVLHLWSGLGYYARARNLHRTAGLVASRYGAVFPLDQGQLQTLPGIGRSTSAAILALSKGMPCAILDGNVRRVLCRYYGVQGWPGQGAVNQALWKLAEEQTPRRRVRAYTQAIMDLGATVCTRSRPKCEQCPLRRCCHARACNLQAVLPTKRPRRTVPVRKTHFVILRDQRHRLLLEQRPPVGVWGGLWCFPQWDGSGELALWCRERFGVNIGKAECLPLRHHTFTHFKLAITPVVAAVTAKVCGAAAVRDAPATLWYCATHPPAVGLARPVSTLVKTLQGKPP